MLKNIEIQVPKTNFLINFGAMKAYIHDLGKVRALFLTLKFALFWTFFGLFSKILRPKSRAFLTEIDISQKGCPHPKIAFFALFWHFFGPVVVFRSFIKASIIISKSLIFEVPYRCFKIYKKRNFNLQDRFKKIDQTKNRD